MYKPIYRFFRYALLRRKLRRHVLKEQKRVFTLLEAEGKLSVKNVTYDITLFEHFRLQNQLTPGEMGILVREVKWMDRNFLGEPYGIFTDWMSSLLNYYTDLEVLRLMLPSATDTVEQLQKIDTLLLSILAQRMIQKRLYLYV